MSTKGPHKRHQTERRPDLLAKITDFMAYDAVGVTAVRGQHRGTRKSVLAYLTGKGIDLSRIPRRRQAFEVWLDDQTEALRRTLPGSKPDDLELWGVARKSLNLFLRSCLYNHYLRRAYHLEELEYLLEVPLDSKVTNGLRNEAGKAGDHSLPPRTSLKNLKKGNSDRFQEYASALAKRKGLRARIFLDHYFFLPKD